MTRTWTFEGQSFDRLECGECGIKFLVPSLWAEARRDWGDHGKRFFCPNGHARIWKESDYDRVRRERDQLKQREAQLNDQIKVLNDHAANQQKQIASMKKREAAGVCPCCQRTFINMARHMHTKHPDYAPTLKAVS